MAVYNENGDKVDEKRDILLEISTRTKERINNKKKEIPFEKIKAIAESMNNNTGYPFEKALRGDEISFICEVKKASPSKGIIVDDFNYIEIAKEYESAGAAAISCLTEPFYFKGNDKFLTEIVENVSIPVLRKDFTIDPYMIYEAKLMGASAILLICAILNDQELKSYFKIADSLGLSVLIEAHTYEEVIRALSCGGRIIGVNNRNLKTFQIDINNSIELKKIIPDEIIFVSESGIKTKSDIKKLRDNGTDAVLIGETLMRAINKKEVLDDLKSL